jgi:hypothetical protein
MRGTAALLAGLALAASAAPPEPPQPFPAAALTEAALWRDEGFREGFRPRTAPTAVSFRAWPKPGPVAGMTPWEIRGRFTGGDIESLTLHLLDAGQHFGYVPRDQAGELAGDRKNGFSDAHARAAAEAAAALQALAGGPGEDVRLGRTPRLGLRVRVFACGGLSARLHVVPEQLVKVSWFRDPAAARSWLDAEARGAGTAARAAARRALVRRAAGGDVYLDDLPLVPQGGRAYCAVSALAMVLQGFGANFDTEDLAAAAEIRYGSIAGSKIPEAYQAAATETGIKFTRTPALDLRRIQAAIDEGLPVIVWRRWSAERDYLHTRFAQRLARDPAARLPGPDAAERASWPRGRQLNHASVITGYHAGRGEVMFTESWSESLRNRRMRVEEMAATAYVAYYTGWRGPDDSLAEPPPP